MFWLDGRDISGNKKTEYVWICWKNMTEHWNKDEKSRYNENEVQTVWWNISNGLLHANASFRVSTPEDLKICTWALGASISGEHKELAAGSEKGITYPQSHSTFGDDGHQPHPFSPR